MNSGFFTLPQEKQQAVINAGFKIFALYPYNKAPMSEIAGAAGISKSLLFYHFKNKKELYIFLWQKSVELIRCALQEQGWPGRANMEDALDNAIAHKGIADFSAIPAGGCDLAACDG